MAALGGSLDRKGLIACICAASLTSGLAAADPTGASPPAAAPPAASSGLSASLARNDFLSQSETLNAAVRLSDPKTWRYQPGGFALNTRPPPMLTVRYRLLPGAALSPYIGGSLITADALAGVNRGGMSLDLKNGASVAVGFDTDKDGQARLKFDMGLQQAFTAGPMSDHNATYDHRASNPTIVGAGFGLRF